jgi:hypothetical protein
MHLLFWPFLGHSLLLPFLFLSLIGLYFLPSFIAAVRRKRNTAAIFSLNFLAGWTFIGWVGALVWAMIKEGQ